MNPVLLLLLLSCTLIHCIQAAFFDPNSCTNTIPCVFVSPNGVDTNNGTSGFPLRTIQKAFSSLATTTTATTIVLADGTYPGDITWSGNSVSLTSLNGPASTFIDCHQQSNRGVYLLAFAEPLSGSISGVTIQNCRSNMGAGIAVMGFKATMSISNCIFVNNYINQTVGGQTVGGAISVQQAAIVTITRCTFINNTATMYGGAIGVATRGVVTVTNSIFDGNQAQQGSVLYDDATSHAIITGCHTRNNVAHEGGILLLNPFSATKFNITSNTYENNLALGNYGADYGSYASSLAFVPNNSTDIGFSGTTPSILPANTTRNFTQEGFDLPSSSFTLILVLSEFLVLDTFGQRYVSLNSTDYYASIVTLPNNNTAPPTPLLPQMLFSSTQLNVTQGMGSSQIIIVGEMGRLYAVDFTLPVPGVTPIRIFVTIKPCPALDIVTLYQGSFPICVHPETVYVADALYTGILVMSCILIACVFIVQALTVYYWHTPVIKGSTPLFMSLMLLGAIIGYLATILSVLDINHSGHFDAVCKSEYWMMGVAFVLMFGTLALKTWRIRNIFCNESLSEIRRNVTTMSLLRWLCLLLAIEMLIHILWISIDPLTASLSLTSSSTLTSTCSSNYGTTFLIVNLVSKGLIAAVCVGYAYQTRDVASRFNESRQLMVASYNMFVCVIVIAALALSLPSMDARRTAYSVGALVVITSTWCVLFIPKLYIAMYKSHENVPSMGSPGSGGKNSNNSNGKNSNSGTGTTNSGKASTGKSTHTYTHTAPQSSKSSFNNGIMLTSLEYGSSSKACSTTSTAPGSPVLPLHKLSPQNNSNSVRVSVSSMGSPLTIGIPKGSSPLLQSTMLHIPRHVGTPLPRPLNVHDDMLDTTTSSIDIEPLPSAGPDMINVQTPPPSSRQGGLQPASEYTHRIC